MRLYPSLPFNAAYLLRNLCRRSECYTSLIWGKREEQGHSAKRVRISELIENQMMERQLISNEVRESFCKFPEKFVDLSDEEVKAIQQSVLNGTYSLSPSRLISFERGDPIQDRFSYILNFPELPTHSFALYIEPEDELVLVALESLLQNRILLLQP
ncbi:hypothetical protein Nepgr_004119 [Nepenthes gracilis]|uniref:Uncharacterized protein n=1 Tax=Nepenthes gracilis TaxID=150966 RepID=A0AAD3XET8_NEPGR|nr:hypothetical protein Nepgr_004119 [Nepenthes gracilis]